ncbi:hypothetical protein DITRI_Ditri08aG0085200 [Diplodiscus trichospermus]
MFAGCTKGAKGSTPLCKGHGRGKRCLYNGGGICPKSVHEGTNFYVAQGGGKRCVVPGCTDCYVREKDVPRGRANVRNLQRAGVVCAPLIALCWTSVISDCIDSLDKTTRRQQLIPPQVLVPLSMKSSSSYSSFLSVEKHEGRNWNDMGISGEVGNKILTS